MLLVALLLIQQSALLPLPLSQAKLQSLTTFAGLDYPSFAYLLDRCEPLYCRILPIHEMARLLNCKIEGLMVEDHDL